MMAGEGVKVAILDTGLPAEHPHFRFVAERSDWTDESFRDHARFGALIKRPKPALRP